MLRRPTSQYIKVKSLLEALAVEMTVCQCIATAKRGVAQGFPRRSRVSIKIQPARLQNLFIKRLFYIHSGAIISFGDSPMVGFPLLDGRFPTSQGVGVIL